VTRGKEWQVAIGSVRIGYVRHGKYRQVWQGHVRSREARIEAEWQATKGRRGEDWNGQDRMGRRDRKGIACDRRATAG